MIRAMLVTRHPMLAKEITIGHIDIANDETGTDDLSHHDIALFTRAKDAAEGELLTSARLENFDRGELSYYDLLHQSLNAVATGEFGDARKLQPRLQVVVNQVAEGTGSPKLEGLINVERLKGGADTAAKFKIDLFATDTSDGQMKIYRTAQLRNFDTTGANYFTLLQAALNAAVQDGFYRRSQS